MTGKERVRVALEGGRPDRVPIVPIYDVGYVMRSVGRDPRERVAISGGEWTDVIEQSFLRHDVDGIFVHTGNRVRQAAEEVLEKREDYWLIRNRHTGEQNRLLPNNSRLTADGKPVRIAPSHGGVSFVQTWTDLDDVVPAPPTDTGIEATGRWDPLRRLVATYPDHHFSFQSGSPAVQALGLCGGYVEAMTTLGLDRDLYRELVARCTPNCAAVMQPGKRAGADSTWFTSYYAGADTISPRDYAEVVFPYEHEVCQAAKDAGLYVLNWFLGDLMPILDKVMELPLDALVLEQGRKGYDIDPAAIRKRVGSTFCLFGFGFENDYCEFSRAGLSAAVRHQIEGAGRDGAFVCGTPIMPPNARPEAVDFYFAEARRLGAYA